MDIDKFYKILGVDEDATEQEIRRRYRHLAKRLHPDHNTSHNAQEQFIMINEAYEGILEYRKNKKEYRNTNRKEKSKEERLKDARKRYYEQIRKEEIENERFFKQLTSGIRWKIMRMLAIIGFILISANLFDYFLPYRYESDQVSAYFLPHRENTQHAAIQTKNGHEFQLQKIDYTLYSSYPSIYVERTRIFHDPLNVISIQKTKLKSFNIALGLYYFKHIFLIIFLFPIFTLFYKRKTVTFTLLYYTSLYFSSTMMLLFLGLGNHFVHLCTLGFF